MMGDVWGMGGALVFSDYLTGALRIAVCLFLIKNLLRKDKAVQQIVPDQDTNNRLIKGKGIAAGFIGSAAITFFLTVGSVPDRNFCRLALETGLIAVCAVRLLKRDVRMSLYIAIFYEIAVSFWQFLLAAGLGAASGNAAFLDPGTVNGQAVVWALHMVLTVGAAIWCRNYDRLSTGLSYRLLSGFVVFGFVMVITLSEQKSLDIPADTFTMWTILAVVLMMSVLVFHINRQYKMEKELAQLKAEQTELLERDYTALNQVYAVNAKLFHDLHNHIGVLRRLLTNGRTEEAVRYLDALQEPVQDVADTVWTGDETADYLINSKRAVAAAQNISFQAQVEFPRNTNIRSADLCAILGNLLDNALEAAGQADVQEQRFVRLVVRRINRMLVMKVENGCAAMPVAHNGELRTTKTDGGLHGWGLKSACTAAEKYDGMVQTSCEGHIFRAVVTLSYPDREGR